MKAAGDAGALERLVCGVLFACGHETGHLVLGELDLAATEGRETDVGDLELVGGGRHVCGYRSEVGDYLGGGEGKERE